MTNYIISLSTIPSKFDYLHLTINSLINQTILPSKIVINISKIYNFRMNNLEIPLEKINNFRNEYSKYNIFINLIDEDYGPGTKLLGLLNSDVIKNSEIDVSNTYIILVDDDLIYKPYMIEHFDNYIKLNNNIDCASYYVYNSDFKIGQGADGFFIKFNTLDNFLKYYDIIKDEMYVKYHDDFFISFYFYLTGKNIEYLIPPYNKLIYDLSPCATIEALHKIENEYSRGNVQMKSREILFKMKNDHLFDFLYHEV